jgi:hypothetical protein
VWKHGAHKGLALEVLGYRIWDPCDGYVIASSDRNDVGPIDASKCAAK